MNSTYISASNHPTFISVLDKLVENQFYIENSMNKSIKTIDNRDLEKAAWLASILSLSEEEEHRKKALIFASLAYLQNKEDVRYEKFCYIIQSRTGNIPASRHLDTIIDVNKDIFKYNFGTFADYEVGVQRVLSSIEVGEEKVYATKFQKDLWSSLENDNCISISAPTSSGKSFVIQSYIVKACTEEKRFKAVYIVPSRALIYQVSSELRDRIKDRDVIIKTGVGIIDNEKYSNKEIFVLTPERCLNLLEVGSNINFKIDMIFMDEIQNVESTGRGVLFEYILKALNDKWPGAKTVVAGPFIKNSKDLFRNICNKESKPIETSMSPVFQLKVSISASKINKKQLLITIFSPTGNKICINYDISKAIYSDIKGSKGDALVRITRYFGTDSKNIIYAPRPFLAEKWATKLSDEIHNNSNSDNERIQQLVGYLSEEVHKDYSLIRCLKTGVAFHHGALPDIARAEIEELYRDEVIDSIVCTPTLLEGVNLPAQKVFVISPKVNTDEMEDFDFGNLIGRAGRLSTSLYGSIYCAEIVDEAWANDRLTSEFDKEIIPNTNKVLSNILELKKKLDSPIQYTERDKMTNTVCLLRQKYLRSTAEVKEYLGYKGVKQSDINMVMNSLARNFSRYSMPPDLARLNPTVDPLLQEQFYQKIKSEGVSKWLITKMPVEHNKRDNLSLEEQRSIPFKDMNFYGQFEKVSEKLNLVFNIESEASGEDNNKLVSIRQIVRDAVPWLRGRPYRALIERDIKQKQEEGKDSDITNISSVEIDSIVRHVTKNINENVRFLLVKYFKIWSDILKDFLSEDEIEDNKYILNLSVMLELGSVDPRALELMSNGISRTIAIEIAKLIPSAYKGSAEEWLVKQSRIDLPDIFKKHLRRLGYDIK